MEECLRNTYYLDYDFVTRIGFTGGETLVYGYPFGGLGGLGGFGGFGYPFGGLGYGGSGYPYY